MKLQIVFLCILCGLMSACDRRSESASASATTTPQVPGAFGEQWKRQQAQLDAYDQHAKRAQEQLQAQADMQKRADSPPSR